MMRKELYIKKIRYSNLACIVLIIVCFFAIVWKCIAGFDIDEQYSYSMMYRILDGTIPIVEMYDSFQFSALLASPVYWISMQLSAYYSVFITRILSVIIYFILSYKIYRFCIQQTKNGVISYLTALTIIIVLPKSSLTLDHSNMLKFMLAYIVIDLYSYLKDEHNHRYWLWIALEHSIMSLCYPTLILLGFAIIFIFLLRKDYSYMFRYVACGIFIAFTIVFPIITNSGIKPFLDGLKMIASDGSHGLSFADELFQIKNDLYYAAKYCIAYFAMFLIVLILKRAFQKKTIIKGIDSFSLAYIAPFIATCFQHILTIASALAGYIRFLFLAILGFFDNRIKKQEEDFIIWAFSLMAFVIICLSSNNGVHENSGYCISLLPFIVIKLNSAKTQWTTLFLLLLTIITSQFCNFIMSVKVSGSRPSGIRSFELVSDNLSIGTILIEPHSKKMFDELVDKKELINTDYVTVLSEQSYCYNLIHKHVFAPVTTSTPHYDSQWYSYFKDNQIKELVVINDVGFSKGNEFINYLKSNYSVVLVHETSDLEIYKLSMY